MRVTVLATHMNTPVAYERMVPRDFSARLPKLSDPINAEWKTERIEPIVSNIGCSISHDRFMDERLDYLVQDTVRLVMDQFDSRKPETLKLGATK